LRHLLNVYMPFISGREAENPVCCYCELTWLVQLTEMSGTSNSGSFVCLLWKGWLNGSLVTNSTWKLTSIYSHFLSRVLHSHLPPQLVLSVCISWSLAFPDFQHCKHLWNTVLAHCCKEYQHS